jgi:hypothetical protein
VLAISVGTLLTRSRLFRVPVGPEVSIPCAADVYRKSVQINCGSTEVTENFLFQVSECQRNTVKGAKQPSTDDKQPADDRLCTIEQQNQTRTDQCHYQIFAQCIYIYCTRLRYVSAIYCSLIWGATSLADMYSVYGNMSQINGKIIFMYVI